ncbi:unnamed protein product [Thelazia callipaeda]|uniref:HAP2-GCS1 domain-containing protein n=1 Tax=Thelazia callipaeda TaxID=103827 RepID=A0A0N5DBT5_THECL|nr:unnamed protein product [Thelazia callipaeda]
MIYVISNFLSTFRDVFAKISLQDRIESFVAYEFNVLTEEYEERKKQKTSATVTSRQFANETNLNSTSFSENKKPSSSVPKSTTRIVHAKRSTPHYNRNYHRIPFAAFVYNFATKKLTDPKGEDKRTAYRGPFLADRWWDRMVTTGDNLKVALPIPDGRLRVNPDPGQLRQYYPHFNSMTLICGQQVDGKLVETDIVVNVDTLVEDPIDEKPECLFSYFSDDDIKKCTIKYENLGERQQDDYGKLDYRYRIQDYQSIPKYFQPILATQYNLKIDIGYEPWSCCTACCCSQKTCGHEYALDRNECKKLESYRFRHAYLSFFKIDAWKKITLSLNVSENQDYMNEVIMTFDKYLSSDPYFTTGIPVHSTLMITDTYWRNLRKFLINKMIGQSFVRKKIKGRLGLYIQSQSCDNLQEKLDCTLLEKCRSDSRGVNIFFIRIYKNSKALQIRIFGSKKREVKIVQDFKISFKRCEEELTIEQISLNSLENFIPLRRGKNYLIQINQTIFGTITKVP